MPFEYMDLEISLHGFQVFKTVNCTNYFRSTLEVQKCDLNYWINVVRDYLTTFNKSKISNFRVVSCNKVFLLEDEEQFFNIHVYSSDYNLHFAIYSFFQESIDEYLHFEQQEKELAEMFVSKDEFEEYYEFEYNQAKAKECDEYGVPLSIIEDFLMSEDFAMWDDFDDIGYQHISYEEYMKDYD